MISLLPSRTLTHCFMKISEDVRQYAAAQGISDKEAVEKGIEEKSKEFAEKGTEVYQPV